MSSLPCLPLPCLPLSRLTFHVHLSHVFFIQHKMAAVDMEDLLEDLGGFGKFQVFFSFCMAYHFAMSGWSMLQVGHGCHFA